MDEEARSSSVVTRLAVVVFLEWLGSTSVLPLLPLYLRQKGATPSTTGVVMASYFIGAVVIQYVAGRASDRYGRRPVLVAGLVGYGLSCLGFLVSLTPIAYGLLRFAQGAAAGSVEVATLAAVAVLVGDSQRGRAASRIYSAQLAGAAIGPLLGAFVGVREMGFIFVFAAVLATGAALPVIRLDLGGREHRGVALPPLGVDARLVGAVCVAVAVGVTIGSYDACWTLLMRFDHATSFELGLSWTLFALPYVVCFRIGGWFADHTNRRVFAVVGVLNACAFCAIYPLLSVDGLLALCCFEAVGSSLAFPAAQSILTEGADPRAVGRRQGVFSTAQTASMGASAMCSGALFELGPAVPFLTMALVGTAIAVGAPLAWRRVPGRVGGAGLVATPPP